jgi:UDP-N-acetylenolpyruvoylglucosamine reductase
VQQRVEETSGIRLEPELRLIGFDRDDEETER